MIKEKQNQKQVYLIILVAALGYFVDIYDLLLFGVIRTQSLNEILPHQFGPMSAEALANLNTQYGKTLLNWQMTGMLVGGVIWGMLGDKRGRLSVLFGSIITYSLANVLNGMVNDTNMYSLLRFISGFGLAGELGAGITLVSETMSKEKRGYGTMIVATVGVSGAVVAGFMGHVVESWRHSYYIGGGMGFILLLLRIGVYESGMFKSVKEENVKRGNFFQLFSTRERIIKYFSLILVTIPVWYFIGTLVFFAPELSVEMGLPAKAVTAGNAIMFAYAGITLGDFASGMISQLIRSRKKTLGLFLSMTTVAVLLYFLLGGRSVTMFYGVVLFGGFATGYWAVFMSTASELFGTNLRATATTTAPNFVRGSTNLISLLLSMIALAFPDKLTSAAITGGIILAVGFVGLYYLRETFGKDLDYIEK